MKTWHIAFMVTLGFAALAATSSPSLAQRGDPLGPAPKFEWIPPGEPRPIPRIAETIVGLDPAPDRPSGAS